MSKVSFRAQALRVFAIMALAWMLVSVAHADFSLEEWRYFKAIQTLVIAEGDELVALPIDRTVFEESANGLRDLRVIQPDGPTEVPYQLVARAGRQVRQSVAGRMRDLGHVPGQNSSFVVDLQQPGSLHNQIEILTASPNFQRDVTVEASADGETWAVLTQEARIFGFTVEERRFTAKNTRVSYPESSLRYLRVKIQDGAEGPIEVGGATVSSVTETPAEETSYPSSIIDSFENTEARTSGLELDIGSQGLPINRLELRTAAVNFYRVVSLYGSNDRENWQTLTGGAEIYSYQTAKFTGERLQMQFPESTYRYYRLVIEDLDDPPLPVEGLEFSGINRRLLFLAQPGSTYALYYGNEVARTPSYDLARLLPYLDTENPNVATLGLQRANSRYAEPQPPASERYPWLITVAVLAAAVVVAAVLFSVFRQARKALQPPDPAEQ